MSPFFLKTANDATCTNGYPSVSKTLAFENRLLLDNQRQSYWEIEGNLFGQSSVCITKRDSHYMNQKKERGFLESFCTILNSGPELS